MSFHLKYQACLNKFLPFLRRVIFFCFQSDWLTSCRGRQFMLSHAVDYFEDWRPILSRFCCELKCVDYLMKSYDLLYNKDIHKDNYKSVQRFLRERSKQNRRMTNLSLCSESILRTQRQTNKNNIRSQTK